MADSEKSLKIPIEENGEIVTYEVKTELLKSETEKFLAKAWKCLATKFENAVKNNAELKNQLEQLQERLLALETKATTEKTNVEKNRGNVSTEPAATASATGGYETEEDELREETEWILKKNKRPNKRKASQSPTVPSPTETTGKSSNKVGDNQSSNKQIVKNLKPPPIILSNVDDYNKVKEIMLQANLKYRASIMNNKQLKINVETDQEYREVTKVMNTNKLDWHTYENKQSRPIRVMARDLHPSCDPEEVKTDLLDKGFKIIDVVNKIKKNKVDGKDNIIRLPLFMLTFENTEDIKKIYNIQHICYMKVKIEALRSNKIIPQCRKCQQFFHTFNFCQHEAVCVKCAGKHLTKDCSKEKSTPPKCYNCGEAHPANYRGCLVAKELQKRRDNLYKDRTKSVPTRVNTSSEVVNNVSYAQVTKTSSNNEQMKTLKPNSMNESNITFMLHEIMKKLDNFSERLETLESRSTLSNKSQIRK